MMLKPVLKDSEPSGAAPRVFSSSDFIVSSVSAEYALSAWMLAWWALPLPVLFGVMATEIWCRSASASRHFGDNDRRISRTNPLKFRIFDVTPP
jgi:hypothetical protein